MKRSPLLFLVCLFAGCFTVIHYKVKLTPEGKWEEIVESGISEDASAVGLFNHVSQKNPTNFFTSESPKVTWWARFHEFTFPSYYAAGAFTVRWYDPQGTEFVEEHVTIGVFKTHFVKCSLPIKDTPVALFPGTWKVAVYYQNQLIDQKQFHILTRYEDAPAHAGPDLWQKSHAVSEADRLFAESFQKAKAYYQQGRYPEAEQLLKSILEKEPHRTEAHLALSAVYLKTGRWEDTLKEIDFVLQNPEFRDQGLKLRTRVLEMKEGTVQ